MSIWGKIFTGLADAAVVAIVAAGSAAAALATGGASAVAEATAVAAGGGEAAGILIPDMNNAINSAFTSTSTPGTPALTTTAPTVINSTYASSNLLGQLLYSVGVQQAINDTLSLTAPSPYFSNYSLYTDNAATANTGCTIASLKLQNNLFTGSCFPSSGSAVQNGLSAGSPSQVPASFPYTNVWASNQTTAAMSIWDAILTGSDVTTNEDGYIILGNSSNSMAAFSPPQQIVNATNGAAAATTPLPSGLAANTTFNLQSGTLTLVGYSVPEPSDPTAAGTNPAPSAQPQIILGNYGSEWVTVSEFTTGSYTVEPTGPWNWVYNSTTGVLTVTGYLYTYYYNGVAYSGYADYFANGSQTINMTACEPNAQVTLTVTPPASPSSYPGVGQGGTGSLTCTAPVTVSATSQLTLNYSQCVSDPWAAGGVIIAVTSAPNSNTASGGAAQLACACIPSYLGGPSGSSPSMLGGVVVGATSSSPNQTCPIPFN